MSRWTRTSSAVAGALLLVGSPAIWTATRPPVTVGEPPAASAEVDVPTLTSTDPDTVVPPVRDAPRTPPEPVETAEPVAEPTDIRIDAIGVDHPVISVGLEADGSMEIPVDINEVGWYEPGVSPGEAGSAVLAGHVDSRAQGRGAFFDLGRLDVDDVVTITHADGSTRDWLVSARTTYPKDQLPTDQLFVWGGDEQQLVLITCGGDFDRSSRHYEDNVVVIARPA